MQFFNENFPKERIFWIGLSAVLIIFIIILFTYIMGFRRQIMAIQELLAKENEKLKVALRDIPTLDHSEIELLKDYGLQDPVTGIADNLEKHTELIPYQAVLGGTMRFHKVYVLTTKWVLASFEDGHIVGNMLLEYSVSYGGDITWRIVASYLH